jgi:hypothetical protein
MKLHLAPLLLLALVPSAHAGPKRVLTAIPRAVGRSNKNMLTFHRKWVALEQWGQVAAILFDEASTQYALHKRPTLVETNPLAIGGRHPSIGMTVLDAIILSEGEPAFTNYVSEVASRETDKTFRNIWHAYPVATDLTHTFAGLHNMSLAAGGCGCL